MSARLRAAGARSHTAGGGDQTVDRATSLSTVQCAHRSSARGRPFDPKPDFGKAEDAQENAVPIHLIEPATTSSSGRGLTHPETMFGSINQPRLANRSRATPGCAFDLNEIFPSSRVADRPDGRPTLDETATGALSRGPWAHGLDPWGKPGSTDPPAEHWKGGPGLSPGQRLPHRIPGPSGFF